MNAIVQLVVQLALVLALAPLVITTAKKTKAFWQSRQGPRFLQGYYDLAKLAAKGVVVSEHASPLTVVAPALLLAIYLAMSAIVPLVPPHAPLGFAGDLFVLVALGASARFLLALTGLDGASPFGGLGTSRETTFGALIEPGLLVAFLAFATVAHATSLDAIAAALTARPVGELPAALGLALVAFLVLLVAETNRVPVDNPATHLELTMVHEAMVLEQAGPNLALVEYANGVKHVVLLGIVAAVLLPWTLPGLALGALANVAKVLALIVAIATSESLIAKWRIFRVPELTTIAFLIAVLGLVGVIVARGGL
ncbi:MAG: respiratory chain complex I subunit 1 family protein [Thermoplasmatota archaeon]